MPALPDNYMEMLKQELRAHFIPHLPALLDLQKPAEEQAKKDLSRALSAFALHHQVDVPAEIAAQSVVDDFNDHGVDAIFHDQKAETLFFVQSKLKASEEFGQSDAQAFSTGVRQLVQQDFSKFNKNVQQRQSEIEEALGSCSHIKLLVAYTGSAISGHASDALNALLADPDLDEERFSTPFETFGPPDIIKALLEEQAFKPINVEIQMYQCERLTEPRTTYFGVVKIADLAELHRQHGKALYEKNIRYFLGGRASNVNRDIQATLKEDARSFFYLNNGVTALCTSIQPKGKHAGKNVKKLKVLGLSIVNGAQTVASAAEVIRENSAPEIANARVLLTLIEAKADGAFGPRVTRARNTQNPVVTANFASLDPQQERLRQELAYFGIRYHYRPEAGAVSDGTNILLQEALTAISWLQADPRFVVWLKSSPASISDANSQYYKAIFSDSLTGAMMANAVLYARSIHGLLRSAEWSNTGVERLTFRHGVHAIGSVLAKRLIKKMDIAQIVDTGKIGAEISTAFDELRQQGIDLYKSTPHVGGPLYFFKSQADTVPFSAGLMERNYGLSDHAALPALKQKQGTESFPQERLFKFMTQQAPQI
jgi:hypothetical protein